MARTAFIAFAGFFAGSVVTASIAYVAHEDLPPVGSMLPPIPAAKPAPPAMLASTAPAVPTDAAAGVGAEQGASSLGRRIATAGFVPNGPLFRFRAPSRAAAPTPPLPAHAPRGRRLHEDATVDHAASAGQAAERDPGSTETAPVADERPVQFAARHDVLAPIDTPYKATPAPAPARTWVADEPGDSRPAWQRYAALTPATDGRPMVAIVVDDVGLSQFRADRVTALPGPLTISILPYGANAREIAVQARQAGHEVLMHIPMEPQDHDHDPGPNALLTNLDPQELQRRLELNLARFDGYVGINNHMGSRFTASELAVESVMQTLRARGLLFLDSVTSTRSVAYRVASQMGIPTTMRDVFIDDDIEPAAIRRQLRLIETIARKRGAAIAIGHPHPETLQALREWLPRLSARGFVLVPISAITARRLAG